MLPVLFPAEKYALVLWNCGGLMKKIFPVESAADPHDEFYTGEGTAK